MTTTTTTTTTTTLTVKIWANRDPSTTTTLSFKLAEIDHNLCRQYIHLGKVIKGINDLNNLISNPHAWTSQGGLGIEPMSLQLHNYINTWEKGAWNHDTFIGLVEWGVARIKRCYDIKTLKITSFRSRSHCVYVITGVAEASGRNVSMCDCRFRSFWANHCIQHSMPRLFGEPGPIPVGYSLHRLTLEKDRLIAEPVTASSFPKKLLSFDIDFPLSVSD
ncbi:hypothetical protein BDV24DRAFT_153923 [Aspergillus arachidicola]|uniref:Uncharacterized protein n=1 Tax=Aspergillus arachidicola TaxID=656916 RepID=A0A5N6XY57_9EURO|nr:hypothetical protein BDV24DRAFT_153923 [Aspergillus arachidicola]